MQVVDHSGMVALIGESREIARLYDCEDEPSEVLIERLISVLTGYRSIFASIGPAVPDVIPVISPVRAPERIRESIGPVNVGGTRISATDIRRAIRAEEEPARLPMCGISSVTANRLDVIVKLRLPDGEQAQAEIPKDTLRRLL